MKQTAVEWLYETLWKQTDFSLPSNILDQAKEMEKQQQDDFAIEFADWIRVCILKRRSYDFENIEKLLEIYKEEIKL
jgi:hypothetical protein